MIRAYRQGLSQIRTPGPYKDSGGFKRLFGIGSVELEEGRYRIVMQPFAGDPVQRAKELVQLALSSGSADNPERWGELYPVYRAILDEVSTLLPEAQHADDAISMVTRLTDDAREKLMRQQSMKHRGP